MIAVLFMIPTVVSAEDITDHWAYDEMKALIDAGIMEGNEDGDYNPDDDVTRAQFAAFLVRALDLSEVNKLKSFKDVDSDKWYYDAVQTAYHYGLINGNGDGYFNPKEKITRQEMAVMLYNAIFSKNIHPDAAELTFTDKGSIDDWAYNEVEQIVSLELMEGKPGNKFAPLDVSSRAEAATVIHRLVQLIEAPEAGEDEEEQDNEEENEEEQPEEPKPEEPSEPEEPSQPEIVHETTNYLHDFYEVVVKQAGVTPKVDGAGKFIATEELVAHYANSNNFKKDTPEYYQFLKLSIPLKNLDKNQINDEILHGKGSLEGKASAFIEAGKAYNINAIYLIAHAIHETGKGTSPLSNGIEVGLDEDGHAVMVTDENRDSLTNIKTTYNMYGIDARDANPEKLGSEHAYREKWFTPEAAIIGGAKYVRQDYIALGQDTLYKMRWNPETPASHQYATHVQWAELQAKKIYDYLNAIDAIGTVSFTFDVPKYKNQPSSSALPAPEDRYVIRDSSLTGVTGVVSLDETDDGLRFRTYPVSGNVIKKLPDGEEVQIIGTNGGWYYVDVDGKEGWVSGDYIKFHDLLKVMIDSAWLNVRSEPSTDSETVGKLYSGDYVNGVMDNEGIFIKEDGWYQITFEGKTRWIHGDYIKEIGSGIN